MRTNEAGIATVALFKNDFVVELKETASEVVLKALRATNEIYGLEPFATVAAIRALGDQLGGKKMVGFSDNDAAAGVLAKASARVPLIMAMIECLWARMAWPSSPRWIERVPSKADAADAPSC